MTVNNKIESVLVIEDNSGDFVLIEEYLIESFASAKIVNAKSLKEAKKLIQSHQKFDVVLLDLSLPDSSGNKSSEKILSLIDGPPVIVLTGFSSKDVDIQSLSLGISDYLLKDELTPRVLAKSILYSIERHKVKEKLKLSEQLFKALVQNGSELIAIINNEGEYTYMSPTSKTVLGLSPDYYTGKEAFQFIHPDDRDRVEKSFRALKNRKKISTRPFRFKKVNGRYIWLETIVTNMLDDPSVRGIVANCRDVTEKINHEKEISRAIVSTQEAERFEISSELHDNVNQLLAAAQIYLSTAIKEAKDLDYSQLLKKSRAYVLESINEIRRLSHRLSPGFKNDFPIEEAIRDLITDIGVKKDFEVITSINIKNTVLPYDLKLNAYRILQEQLNNIIKHSEATEAHISLNIVGNKLVMKTSDNGKGFDTKKKKKGIGLNNMEKRVVLFSGTFNTKSKKGKGTEITIEIPL